MKPLIFLTLALIASAAAKPNVVVILADDLGYGDVACYNPESKIATPHLDRMAAGGMRFTDAHTPSAVCTPTRYGLLTGRYCWRTRLKNGVLDGFSPPLIESDRVTVASFLRGQGYDTACFGKWHLGMQWTRTDGSLENLDREDKFRPGTNIDFTKPLTSGPLTAGFQTYFGISASLDMPTYAWIEQDRCTVPDGMSKEDKTLEMNQPPGVSHSAFHLDEVLGTLKSRSMAWIQARKGDETPFFLYLPLSSPHLPIVPGAAFRGKSPLGPYGDFVMETDDFAGGILDALREAGKLENTLVIFTSDNGGLWHEWTPRETDDVAHYKPTGRAQAVSAKGHHGNAHLRGTKADIWEGGHRVPLIVHWPAAVKGGQATAALTELTDLLATCAELTDQPLPAGAGPDSRSFLPALKDASHPGRDFAIHHSLQGNFAIRQGPWKLAELRGSGGFSTPKKIEASEGGPAGQLYNLETDPAETRNVYAEHPEVVARLQAKLDSIRKAE